VVRTVDILCRDVLMLSLKVEILHHYSLGGIRLENHGDVRELILRLVSLENGGIWLNKRLSNRRGFSEYHLVNLALWSNKLRNLFITIIFTLISLVLSVSFVIVLFK
jgi:hypothetical protein